jgi:nitrate/TMAO reductase-like tetraheme cytochrome c subunit
MPVLRLLSTLQDSVTKVVQPSVHDSITFQAPPPLPGGPATVARFLLNTVPQWLQITGVIVGAVVAVVLVVLALRHWRAVLAWFSAKSGSWKTAFAGVVVMAIGVSAYAGVKTWTFMMHDNAFCSGCHVMNTPFQKFGAAENKHAKLLCHDCHQQSIFASMKELYVWVSDRPEKIPPHPNNVPNAVCAQCHIKRNADSTWKRVSATAGHQVHLNGKSPLFKELECIVCHAREVHRFKAVDKTCGQSGCHDKVRIQLGTMSNQTDLHCVTCHQFTQVAVEANPIDSARAGLTPQQTQCFSCHAMKRRLANFDPKDEPHKNAVCGTCHNPHVQTTMFGAYQSCATSSCHAKSDTLTAMHRGLKNHALENCGACHVAHTWKARAKDCKSCHQDIERDRTRTRRGGVRLSELTPQPNARRGIARPTSWTGGHRNVRRVRVSARHGTPRPVIRQVAFRPQVAADTATFSHRRHRTLACTSCHNSSETHGAVTVVRREQCQSCHHANDARGAKCVTCHSSQAKAASHAVTVPMHVASLPAKDRTLTFQHNEHGRLECATCHTTDLNRRVEKDCTSCHEDHHAAERRCASCHADARPTHTREVHLTGCAGAGCHLATLGAVTQPVRSVCLACHAAQASHKPGQDCAPCHLASWPHGNGR